MQRAESSETFWRTIASTVVSTSLPPLDMGEGQREGGREGVHEWIK